MAIVAGDWTVDRETGDIRYIGHDHNGASPSYATVIEFHRWLQGLADDASSSGDDELDITDFNPSSRSTDNIIRLLGAYNINDNAAEHLYDGTIIQGTGITEAYYDGIVNFGNAGVMIQIIQNGAVLSDDWWNYSEGGTHTGSANAATLTDSGKSWTTNQWVGYFIKNVTDGSMGLITANTGTTITATLSGGTENDWDASDAYLIAQGLNPDATQGISHRFMVKTRTAGADIDGRRLIGTCRRFGFTFSEFSINGTARGNNVLALSDASDLNNTTAGTTVAGWSDVTNLTSGYVTLDVDNNGTPESYYSQWDRGSRTINQFYERMKWISRDGSSDTLYGISGELFRGITHEINISSGSGTWGAAENLTWTGGSGRLLAVNNTAGASATKLWMQLLTGVAPTNTQTITGGTSSATAVASGTAVDRSALIAKPFVGQSTGSALIGSYGLGVQIADLTAADKVFDLTNTQKTPPNYVTFIVGGLANGEDRVLVGPWDGSTTDAEGNPEIDYNQLTLNTSLTTANVASVVVSAAIPSDTPAAGWIRVQDNNGFYRRIKYSSWTGSTFTVDTAWHTANDSQNDFDVVAATAPRNVWIAYLDYLYDGTTGTDRFTSIYNTNRNLVVKVRDGGGSPIKEFISSAVLGSNGGSITAIRTSDT